MEQKNKWSEGMKNWYKEEYSFKITIDLSNLLAGATKHSGEFICSDGVVTFKLEAFRNE